MLLQSDIAYSQEKKINCLSFELALKLIEKPNINQIYKTTEKLEITNYLKQISNEIVFQYLFGQDEKSKISSSLYLKPLPPECDETLSTEGLEEGPLPKSNETALLEQWIIHILTNRPQFDLSFDEQEELIMTLNVNNSQQVINLSLLLQKANLNHLCFEDKHLELLDEYLKSGFMILWKKLKTENWSMERPAYLKALPACLVFLLRMYTGYNFSSVNNLLRGTRLFPEVFSFLSILEIVFIPFALNKMRVFLVNEMKITDEDSVYYRADSLEWLFSSSAYADIHKVPRLLPITGLTSTSVNEDKFCGNRKNIKIVGCGPQPQLSSVAMCPQEEEVLFSHTQALLRWDEKTNCLIMRPVSPLNSIQHLPLEASLAIRYAHKHYLSKPYSNGSSRSNHGVEHTLRTLFYVGPVIQYFLQWAADPDFLAYCNDLSSAEKTLIQIAMVFAVVGRDSEIALKDNPKLYREYRTRSALSFKKYAEEISLEASEITRFTRLVLCLGDITFLSELKDNLQDNFIFHMMNLVHKLDLLRCYSKTEYNNALECYCEGEVIRQSDGQQKHFEALQQYAARCIQATGFAYAKDSSPKTVERLLEQVLPSIGR